MPSTYRRKSNVSAEQVLIGIERKFPGILEKIKTGQIDIKQITEHKEIQRMTASVLTSIEKLCGSVELLKDKADNDPHLVAALEELNSAQTKIQVFALKKRRPNLYGTTCGNCNVDVNTASLQISNL